MNEAHKKYRARTVHFRLTLAIYSVICAGQCTCQLKSIRKSITSNKTPWSNMVLLICIAHFSVCFHLILLKSHLFRETAGCFLIDYNIRASLRPLWLRSERHACYMYDYIAVHRVAERRCDNKVAYFFFVPSYWETYWSIVTILPRAVEKNWWINSR